MFDITYYKMSHKNITSQDNQQESDGRSSNSHKNNKIVGIRQKRKLISDRQRSNRNSSYESSQLITSLAKVNYHMESPRQTAKQIQANLSSLPQFTQKYLPRGSTPQQIYEQMIMMLNHKERQIQALRVYRDEFKFIFRANHTSHGTSNHSSMKINIKLLQDKAQIQFKMKAQKTQIQQQIKNMDIQNKNIRDYTQLLFEHAEQYQQNNQFLDIGKQKEIMVENIRKQVFHLMKQINEEKRKNMKQVKQIQDQILNLRIIIKQKQDKIRELKAKICTHYIKLHSRNSSNSRSSKDKNMSMSVRKFNTANNQTIRQTFIGNTQFKSFSKQILQKVEKNQLIKIKFYKNKQKLLFQCFYEAKEGVLHANDFDYTNTNEKKQKIQGLAFEEVYIKYLMSIKFYFKSSLVGVQCRIKTDKGNKHIYIGCCQSNIQHQLVTLVNRKLITLGSYWHLKQMIGVSVWFIQLSSLKKIDTMKKIPENKNNGVSFEQYYA